MLANCRKDKYRWMKCSLLKFASCIALFTVFWNEFLSYSIQCLSWPSIRQSSRSGDTVRLVFVADPQLQGYYDSYLPYHFLSGVAIFDADRYLSHGFTRAISHVQPDVIVFLGDLLDEGSTALESDFLEYAQRFHKIFYTPENVQKLYISGDNDVGGETFSDPKEKWKVERFEKLFASKSLTSIKFVDFIKLNVDWGNKFDAEKVNFLTELATQSDDAHIRLLLNHMTVLDTSNEQVTTIAKGNAVISAHTHKSGITHCSRELMENIIKSKTSERRKSCVTGFEPIKDGRVYTFDLNDKKTIHEFTLPTCSYRMGVPKMGYGAAVIDENGEMTFTLLILPSRYPQLYMYGVVGALIAALVLAKLLIKLALR